MEKDWVYFKVCFIICCHKSSFLVFLGEFFVMGGSTCFAVPVTPVFAVGFESTKVMVSWRVLAKAFLSFSGVFSILARTTSA